MIALADFPGLLRAEIMAVIAHCLCDYPQAETRSKAGCQALKTDGRSDREAGAVRGHSLSPRPARRSDENCGLCAAFFCFHLTPARLDAMNLVGQCHGSTGSGVAVPDGTEWNHCWNLEQSEIIALFVRFHGFRATASRYVRAGLRGGARVYVRGGNLEPLEPSLFLLFIERVRGSNGGSKVVPVGTVVPSIAANGAVLPILNKLAGIKCSNIAARVVVALSSTVLGASAGKSFGDFGRRRGADRAAGRAVQRHRTVALAGSVRLGRNGAILRFSRGRSGHVGRPILEGAAQAIGKTCFSPCLHLPVRPMSAARSDLPRRGASIVQGGTPMPPFARVTVPSMLPHERGQIWNGISACRIAQFNQGIKPRGCGSRQSWSGDFGSGSGIVRSHTARMAAGRGLIDDAGDRLSRTAQASGRSAHVN